MSTDEKTTTTTAVAASGTSLLALRQAANLPADLWPDERIKAVKAYAAPSAKTPAQLAAFLSVCARYNLDPMVGQLFLIEADGSPRVCAGRDTWLAIAGQKKTYRGCEFASVYEKDDFRMQRREDGAVQVHHVITGFNRGKLVGAYAVVRDERYGEHFLLRNYADYAALHNKKNWRADAAGMMENRVIALVLRKVYGFPGLFIEGEEGGDTERQASTSTVATVTERTRAAMRRLDPTADAPMPAEAVTEEAEEVEAVIEDAEPATVEAEADIEAEEGEDEAVDGLDPEEDTRPEWQKALDPEGSKKPRRRRTTDPE